MILNGTNLSGNLAWTMLKGASAYEIAKAYGYTGTEEEWLLSLRYDHSDEFVELSKSVLEASIATENAKNESLDIKSIVLATEKHVNELAAKMNADVDHVDEALDTFDEAVIAMYLELASLKTQFDNNAISKTNEFNRNAQNVTNTIYNYRLDAINAKNDAVKAREAAVAARDTTVEAKKYVEELHQNVEDVSSEINASKASVDVSEQYVRSAEARIIDVDTKIVEIHNDVTISKNQVDADKQIVTDAKNRIEDINTNIEEIHDSINTSKNEVDSNTQIVSEAKTYIKGVEGEIDKLLLFKFPNATIVGQPLIESGQVSRFTTSDYLTMPFIVDVRNKPFEVEMCFTTGADVNTQQNILDSEFGLALAIQNGKGIMALSSNGTSWDIGLAIGTISINPNTTYYAKIVWDGSVYKTSISVDGETFIEDMSITSSLGLYPRSIYIGGSYGLFGNGTAHVFKGGVNLNNCYLTIAGLPVWQGMDDAGLSTRADVSLKNLDADGEKRFSDLGDALKKVQSETTEQSEEIAQLRKESERADADNDRRLTNLEYASKGVLYREDVSESEDYTKVIASDVMPYGFLDKVGAKSVVWNQLANIGEPRTVITNGIEFTVNADKTITVNGTASENSNLNVGRLYANNHKILVTGLTGGVGINLACYTEGGQWIKSYTSINDSVIDATFDGKYISLNVYINSGKVVDNVTTKIKIIDLTTMFGSNEPTLEQCQQIFTEDYRPYAEPTIVTAEPVNVVSRGKNLFDWAKWRPRIFSGKAVYENNGVTITSTKNDAYTAHATTDNGVVKIPVKAGKTYTLSWESDGLNEGLVYIFPNGKTVGNKSTSNIYKKLVYTVPDGVEFIIFRFGVYHDNTTISYKNIQFEEGSESTAFAPYVEQNIKELYAIISKYFHNGMHSSGIVYDYFDVENGVAVQNVAYNKADETYPTILLQSINSFGIANFILEKFCGTYYYDGFNAQGNVLCNILNPQTDVIANIKTEGFFMNTSNTTYIRIESSKASTVEQFKDWISENPIEITWALLTPIITPLDAEDIEFLKNS